MPSLGRRKRVLVIDDDPVALGIVRVRLEAEGFKVITHDNSLGTSALVLREQPHVILLDISMPGLSGNSLARLSALRGTPIIYHSSKSQDELDRLVRETKVLGAIRKTSDAGKFVAEFYLLLRRVA